MSFLSLHWGIIVSDDEGPIQHRLKKYLIVSIGVGALVFLTFLVTEFVEGVAILLTSLVSSAVLIIVSPNLRQCHPIRVISCHCLAMAIGVVVHQTMPGVPGAIGISVGLALFCVLILDALHPPAIANAAFPFAVDATALELMAIATVGALILASASVVAARQGSASSAFAERVSNGLSNLWFRRRGGGAD